MLVLSRKIKLATGLILLALVSCSIAQPTNNERAVTEISMEDSTIAPTDSIKNAAIENSMKRSVEEKLLPVYKKNMDESNAK